MRDHKRVSPLNRIFFVSLQIIINITKCKNMNTSEQLYNIKKTLIFILEQIIATFVDNSLFFRIISLIHKSV